MTENASPLTRQRSNHRAILRRHPQDPEVAEDSVSSCVPHLGAVPGSILVGRLPAAKVQVEAWMECSAHTGPGSDR
jgi:hypothetical protein